jgi:endoglucanase
MPLAYPISDALRAQHEAWLLSLTQTPTASGRESRVIEWIRRWVAERPELKLTTDGAGNLQVMFASQAPSPAPVYFTAHLDHPAFVVEKVLGPARAQVQFRGGVMEEYFEEARIVVHAASGAGRGATLKGGTGASGPLGKSYLAELDGNSDDVEPGDIATWELPPARVSDGLLHTNACDDLAAAAGALAAYDVLLTARRAGAAVGDVRLLFTRAEEIGFVGALAAVREKTMPPGSRVIALENSRSFEDSPIGGGPIVRVGDRLSIFSPSLTGAIAARAEEVAGGPASPTASQKQSDLPAWKWQRKLMAGGACEATVFCAYGYEATCVCLPLGNYHNMADLAAVQAGTFKGRPRVGPEFISIADFRGLVDLLVACGTALPAAPDVRGRVDRLWDERRMVLGS